MTDLMMDRDLEKPKVYPIKSALERTMDQAKDIQRVDLRASTLDRQMVYPIEPLMAGRMAFQ